MDEAVAPLRQFTNPRLPSLRDVGNAADGYGAQATEEEAQRWERLANAARAELAVQRPQTSVISSRGKGPAGGGASQIRMAFW